jgi:hypothetical protein
MSKSGRKANAQSRPGLREICHNGGTTKRDGDAALAGNTRALMRQGTTKMNVEAPVGKLRGIIRQ